MNEKLTEQLIDEMRAVFGQDTNRIDHAMKVLDYARRIRPGQNASELVVTTAAILHDIGIVRAEQKHGSAAGPYQELEGPPIAREIMKSLSMDDPTIDHVCRIIANHHSDKDIDTAEFRVIWDADWLVNFPGQFPKADGARRDELIGRIFKTAAGAELAKELL